MTFWYGYVSGSLDPDSVLYVSNMQDANKKYVFSNLFCLLLSIGKVHFICLQRSKVIKKSLSVPYKSRFSLMFCLLIEGSGSVQITGTDPDLGGPRNIRIRIRNTSYKKEGVEVKVNYRTYGV